MAQNSLSETLCVFPQLPSTYLCPCSGLRQAPCDLGLEAALVSAGHYRQVAYSFATPSKQKAAWHHPAVQCWDQAGTYGETCPLGRKGYVCLFGDHVGREGELQS